MRKGGVREVASQMDNESDIQNMIEVKAKRLGAA